LSIGFWREQTGGGWGGMFKLSWIEERGLWFFSIGILEGIGGAGSGGMFFFQPVLELNPN
jgi:hypothetical protein